MRKLETNDWWPDLLALKDELSLRELAERFSVTPGAISAALKREGTSRDPAPPGPRVHRKSKGPVGEDDLPPEPGEVKPRRAARPARATARTRTRASRVDDHVDLLGTVPDRVVAEAAGVTVNAVRNYRVKLGIPAAGQATPAAREPGAGAWQVSVEVSGRREAWVVVARDLVEAAQRAAAGAADRLGGHVVGISWLGGVL